jgi:sodium transport system permease protein
MAALLPALLPLLPGIDLTPLLAAVPVAGTTLLIRDALAGGVDPLEGVVAVGSSMLWAWLGLRVAAGAFGSEGVVFGVAPASGDPDDEWSPEGGGLYAGGAPVGPPDGRGPGQTPEGGPSRPPVPLPRQVAFFIAGVAVLFFYGSRLLPGVLGESGILVAQVLFLLLPSILFLRAGGFPLGSALALRRPSGRDMTAGLMIILGGLPVAWVLAWLQGFVIPLPREFMEAMAELLRADEPGRLLWLLLLVAVTPAICEEVVFRGVLLQGTRRLGATTAILLNAAVFGAFHLSFETVYRFLPTFWLGLLLATVAWHTRSLWVVMVMHGVNNGIVVLLAALPWLRERMGDPEAAPPLLLVPIGVALLIGGMRLLRSGGAGPTPSPRGSPGGL